uniref:Argininosuccinate lyase n=1 Tax=Thermosporothrix sp. COM3 TaxID=2490863 RepID=A0A455SMG1_9CHLR|nr:argininosuccinate lyase [Thermosporothrix sp. COM3]
MMGYQEEITRVEGDRFPGKTYAEVVLEPAFNEAKRHLLAPMMAIHKAHLIMLYEQGLLTFAEAQQIARALQALDLEEFRQSEYTGEYEDLFFQVEDRLLHIAGEIAGNLHLARSRNDMGIAIYRMVLREKLLGLLDEALAFRDQLLAFAQDHVETYMIGHTHTQQAQPTTMAHYIVAVTDLLERDIKRLIGAYERCNRSSMGAAALTTSGFAISRERMMELLAFDALIENSYDAIAGADYLAEIAATTQVAAINMGRVVQDLLQWCTQEFAILKVAAPYVQISSIMPQKRNPVSLEHSRALLSSCVSNAQTVVHMMHNTPFGDIVDTEDDMQPYLWKSLDLLGRLYHLLSCVIGTVEVNKEILLQRLQGSFATITELADTLVRTDGLAFRTAHHIASGVVKVALERGLAANEITLALVNDVAQEIIGRPLSLTEAGLKLALDPIHFVKIRSLPGGPEPEEIRRAIASRHEQQATFKIWLAERRNRIAAAEALLDETLQRWNRGEEAR